MMYYLQLCAACACIFTWPYCKKENQRWERNRSHSLFKQ